MSRNNSGTDVAVVLGIVLVVVGLVALVSPLLGPLRYVFVLLARIGWPIVLIIIGLLFILRARGRGWNTGGKPFVRSRADRMLGGVIGGAAGYLGVSSTLLRVAYAFLTLISGVWPGIVAYLLAMLFVPEEPLPADYAPPPAPEAPAPPSRPTPPPPPVPASPAAPAAPEPPKAPAVPAPPASPAPSAS